MVSYNISISIPTIKHRKNSLVYILFVCSHALSPLSVPHKCKQIQAFLTSALLIANNFLIKVEGHFWFKRALERPVTITNYSILIYTYHDSLSNSVPYIPSQPALLGPITHSQSLPVPAGHVQITPSQVELLLQFAPVLQDSSELLKRTQVCKCASSSVVSDLKVQELKKISYVYI